MFFEDADDLDFAGSGFLDGVSSRPLASEFSTYFRSLFQATRHHMDSDHGMPRIDSLLS